MKIRHPEFIPKDFENFPTVFVGKQKLRARYEEESVRVAKCNKHSRCQQGDCPVCLRRLRLGLIDSCADLALHEKAGEWFFLTLYTGEEIPYGQKLSGFDLIKFCQKNHRRLYRAMPEALFIGGVDFVLKMKNGKPFSWLPHLHGMLFGISKDESLKRLRGKYEGLEKNDHPIHHMPVGGTSEDFFRILTYCYKSTFKQKPEKERGSVKFPVTPVQDFDLRSFLQQYKVDERLVLVNAKKLRTTDRARINLSLNSPYDDIFKGLSSGSVERKREEGSSHTLRGADSHDSGLLGIDYGYTKHRLYFTKALPYQPLLASHAYQNFEMAVTSETGVTAFLSHLSHPSQRFHQLSLAPTATIFTSKEITMFGSNIVTYRLKHATTGESYALVNAPSADGSDQVSTLLRADIFYNPTKLKQELQRIGVSDKIIKPEEIQKSLPAISGVLVKSPEWVDHQGRQYFPFFRKQLRCDDGTKILLNTDIKKFGLTRKNGSLERWERDVGHLAVFAYLPMLSMLAAFAGPLRALSGDRNRIIFNFYGGNAEERNSLTNLAASIMGSFSSLPSWTMPPEELVGAVNAFGQATFVPEDLILDSNITKADKQTLDSNIATIAGLKHPQSTKAVKSGLGNCQSLISLFCTSEDKLSSLLKIQKFGPSNQHAILFEVETPNLTEGGIWSQKRHMFADKLADSEKLSRELTASLIANYGTVGEKWINYLSEDPLGRAEEFSRKVDSFIEDEDNLSSFESRARRFTAQLHVTGRMAYDAEILWGGPGLVHFACMFALKEILKNGPRDPIAIETYAKALVEEMCDLENYPQNPTQMDGSTERFDKAGFIKTEEGHAYIKHDRLQRIIQEMNANHGSDLDQEKMRVIGALERKGIYIRPKTNDLTKSLRPGKGMETVRMLEFNWKLLQEFSGLKINEEAPKPRRRRNTSNKKRSSGRTYKPNNTTRRKSGAASRKRVGKNT